jgi:Right handed beta helix region
MTIQIIKRNIEILILSVLFIFFFTVVSRAATFYIDYQSGYDSKDGTSTSTPWKHSPGDPRATNNANITLSPGDTVVFKGGATYSFDSGSVVDYIAANASGSPGNVITYISGHVHSSSWGSGRAIIDGTDANPSYPSATGIIILKNYSYITVKGLEVKNQPTVNAAFGLIAWLGKSGGNIIIENNKVHNSGGQGIRIQGGGIDINPSGFIIRNNDITLTNYHGVIIRWGVDDALIENNTFDLNGVEVYTGTSTGNNLAIAYDVPGGGGAINTNLVIRGNDFNDTAEDHPTYVPSKSNILLQQDTTGTIIEDNYFHGKPHYSSIDFAGPQTNVIIRNNVFNVYVTGWQGALSFETDQGSGVSYSGIDIFNNIFVTEPGNGRGIIFFGDGNSTQLPIFTNVDIRNNIIDMDTDTEGFIIYIETEGGAPVVDLSTLTIDYNAYRSDRAKAFSCDGLNYNFANWKTYLSDEGVIGADANSKMGTVIFRDKPGKDFRLSNRDVSAKDNGVDLSSKGFSKDKVGILRPKCFKWDIGAYELDSCPKNLRLIP